MPSQIVQTLITELTADGTKLRNELAKSNKDLLSWGAKATNSAKKIGVGIAAAGAGAALGLAALTKSSIDNADELSKLSQIVGVNIGDLSKLKYAAELSDVSLDQLSTGLKKFSKNIIEAKDGTGAQADAFAELGISLKNSDGTLKSTDQLMGDVADAFSRFEDGANKTTLATTLFGKAGADLIPMLNGGRQTIKEAGDELERMGGVIDEKTGLAAERFNDNLNRLEISLGSMGNVIAKEVTEPLADLSDVLADPDTQKGLADMAAGFVSLASAAVSAVGGIGSFTESMAKYVAGLEVGFEQGDIEGKLKRIATLQAEINGNWFSADVFFGGSTDDFTSTLEEKIKELNALKSSLLVDAKKLPKPAPKPTEDKWSADAMAADEADKMSLRLANRKATEAAIKESQAEQKRLNELYEKEIASMKESLALTEKSTELEKIQYREKSGDLKNLSDVKKKELEGLAQEIDAQKYLNDLKEWAKEQDAEALELRDLILSDEERINKVWDARIQKMKQFGMSDEEITKANKKRQEEIDEALKRNKTELDKFTDTMYENIQGGLADAIMAGFDGSADNLLKSWGNLLKRMFAEAAAADLMRAVFGEGFGGREKSQGGLGTLIGGLGNIFGGMFADGGRPPMGKISVVGDGGEPELFVPDTAGTIVPFSKLSGGDTFHFGDLVFPGVTNAREAELAAGAAGRKLLSVLNGARRYS